LALVWRIYDDDVDDDDDDNHNHNHNDVDDDICVLKKKYKSVVKKNAPKAARMLGSKKIPRRTTNDAFCERHAHFSETYM